MMQLEEAQKEVDNWIRKYGVRYFSELTNLALLTEEIGELARIVARKFGDQSFKDSDKDRDLESEMGDILFVLICLANQTGSDLTRAFGKSLHRRTERDSKRHRDNPKLR